LTTKHLKTGVEPSPETLYHKMAMPHLSLL